MRQKIGLATGPLSCLLVLLLPSLPGLSSEGQMVLALALLMAVWWITEALPIAATALIPLAWFPLLGIAPAKEVATAYMDPNIVLFMGGFFLAMSIQKWELHRRIALAIIAHIGGNLRRLVLGFMLATAFVSMWVSNTATAIMMLPIGTGVILQLKDRGLRSDSRFPVVLMLSIAYSASIGGVATLIGTPPNVIFASQFASLFPGKPPVGFVQWMALGVPLVCLFLPLVWYYLTTLYAPIYRERVEGGVSAVREEYRKLGPMSRGEKGVAAIFVLTAAGWIFRTDLPLGFVTLPGWAPLLGVQDYVHDSTVAVFSALLLFSIPVKWNPPEFLLDWQWARKIPWGVLILFGGGIALANAFQSSGLAAWVGEGLEVFQNLPLILLILIICLMLTFLTEITSNTATASIFMPVLAGTALAVGVAPEFLMIPATISASCAFMLPVATPPNAIVFGSRFVTTPEMSRAGFWLNLTGAAVVTLLVYFTVGWIFGVSS